jgi:3-hydroxyisobutyrate dehydrogenase-like beta-hydroxyacid dehydrogenase
METLRVGFVGLGRMGKPMCRNLLRAGFPLAVFNRSQSAVNELVMAGAHRADSAADVAAHADIILSALPSPQASETVFLGRDGLVTHASPGQIFVEVGTIGPSLARRIAEAAERRGCSFLDAPVSGGPEGARDATLTVMVGGTAATVARADAVLRTIGSTVRRMGEVGAGSIAKLVNQALTAIHTASAAEALVLGTAAGVDPAALLEVLATSYGQSRMLDRSGPRILDRKFEAAAPLRLLMKDLDLVEALASEVGAPLPLTTVVQSLCSTCEAMGLSESDLAALVRPFECEAGSTVCRSVAVEEISRG